MTDKERLLELLESFDITPVLEHGSHHGDDPVDTVTLEAGEGGVEGFPFFVCTFSFRKDGSFKGVGVWE